MDLAKEKIVKAIESSLESLVHLHKGDKRLSIGSLDESREKIIAAIHILINEVKEEEGRF